MPLASVRVTAADSSSGFGYSEADLPGALANTGANAPAANADADADADADAKQDETAPPDASPADPAPADDPTADAPERADDAPSLAARDYGLYEALVLLRGLYTLRPNEAANQNAGQPASAKKADNATGNND